MHNLSPMDWILGFIAIASWFGGLWLYISPGIRRNKAVADAILGEAQVTDRSGQIIQPARPGLVHLQHDNSGRLSKVEETLVEFRHLVGINTEMAGKIGKLDHRVSVLEDQRVRDIVHSAERAATATVSAEMLRLANERDTVPGEAHEADELGK